MSGLREGTVLPARGIIWFGLEDEGQGDGGELGVGVSKTVWRVGEK